MCDFLPQHFLTSPLKRRSAPSSPAPTQVVSLYKKVTNMQIYLNKKKLSIFRKHGAAGDLSKQRLTRKLQRGCRGLISAAD